MEYCTLRVFSGEGMREVQTEAGALLSDALQSAGFEAPTPCGGLGKCGKCRLRAAGALTPSPDGNGTCLACQTRVSGDASVWLGEARKLEEIEGEGVMPALRGEPMPGEYGFAVDIGTTTLAARLVRLREAKLLPPVTSENPQRLVAHDVIGRIQASLEGRRDELREMIRSEIQRLEGALCAREDIDPGRIGARVYTGNTAMLYLLTGRSPKSLAAAPFIADCLFGFEEGGVYLPQCFGAYVGADITCAVLASGMTGKHRTAMLIDIGTNGEIALWHRGKLYCCATAAGPAFEGVGISCGVSGVRGAIESVRFEDGELKCSTIGGAPAVGICGSGIIDATAALLDAERLEDTGFLEEDAELAPGVTLTRKDVRMIQLAKGSICAGMMSLMAMAGVNTEDVETLYIAGGFGRHIDVRSALRIGLIPDFPMDRVRAIGNAAFSGAVMYLLDRAMPGRAKELIGAAECVNLAQTAEFQMFYPECMMFPEE